MYIHFAESRRSNKCNLYNCLYEAKARSGLLSCHYRDGEKYFAIWWNELVKIHLATTGHNFYQYDVLVSTQQNKHLHSYAYQEPSSRKKWEQVWEKLNGMHIHLTDTTAKLNGTHNIKSLLPDENQNNYLYSSAYPQQEKDWAIAWERSPEDMNIYLAGHAADLKMDGKVKSKHPNHLTTYADKKEVDNTIASVIDFRPRVLIDSGAFTAFTTGKIIKPQDYAQWALGFKKRWEHKMAFLRFMNLDVIGDQEASWENQLILEKLGVNPIPIVTYGADLKHLHRALEYDYLALGGLVPYIRQKKKLQAWLDRCFKVIVTRFKKTGVMPKVHLLGVTSDWVLKRYPCYSSDSSTWVSCLRFGGGDAAGIKKLPRYKDSDAALAATIHTLRAEIKKYQKMEQEATKLWQKRGIIFEQ